MPSVPLQVPTVLPLISHPVVTQAQPMQQHAVPLQATVAKIPPVPWQPMPLQPVLPGQLPAVAQPVEPLLEQLPPMLQQRMPLQPVLPQALPAITQPLAPVLQQLPSVMQQAMPMQAEPVQIDRRPALARQAPAVQRPAPVIQGDTITIQVHAAPGMDPQALAREVERLLDQRERAKAARLSNSFTDWN